MKNFYYTVLFFAAGFLANAQSPPQAVLDVLSSPGVNLNLQLNLSLSDEFDGPQLDWRKWKSMDPTDGWITAYPSMFYPENNSVSGGNLIISGTDETHVGAVTSIRENLHYGYYEIRAQLAQYDDPVTGEFSTDGMWGGFWLVKSRSHPALPPHEWVMLHDEIDIQERLIDGSMFSGVHILTAPNYGGDPAMVDRGKRTMKQYQDFHTYGLLYLPDRMIFYVDGVADEGHEYNACTEETGPEVSKTIFRGDCAGCFPSHPLKVLLTHQINDKINSYWCAEEDWDRDENCELVEVNGNPVCDELQPPLSPARPWPIDFIVEYFRFYEYMGKINNNVNASTVTTLNTEFDFYSKTNGVRNNITIEGSNIELLATKNYLLRARGTTTIKGTFKAAAGSKLKIVPTPASVAPQFVAKNLSLDETSEGVNTIIVYPNPANTIVSFKGENLESYTMSLYNLEGRKILEKSISDPVNISSLAKGMYIYLLTDNSGNKKQGKLVIE